MSNAVTNACRPLAVKPARKAVLMCLADRANDDGEAWPSVPWICEWTCLGRTAVMGAVKWLEGAGLVTVRRESGKNNRIALQLGAIASFNPPASRTGPPPGPVRQTDHHRSASRTGVVRQTDGSSPPPGPETSVHQEDTRETVGGGAAAVPTCPHRELLALFGKHLPELPQPRPELWSTSKNADAMRARWRWVLTAEKEDGSRYATNTQEGVTFFDRFFEHVADSDFLTGRNNRWHGCDLGWLMKAGNFEKVVQGNYDDSREPPTRARAPVVDYV